MNKWIEKLFGIDKIRAEAERSAVIAAQAAEVAKAATEAAERATEAETQAKLSPKERATSKGEPWVAVLDTKVNPDNIRNGFFELDWNDLFIVQLRQAGYGFEGDPDEEIVDRWFRDIVSQMLSDEGMDTNRGAGYINVVPIAKGKSEVS
jgi:hypothetical protein